MLWLRYSTGARGCRGPVEGLQHAGQLRHENDTAHHRLSHYSRRIHRYDSRNTERFHGLTKPGTTSGLCLLVDTTVLRILWQPLLLSRQGLTSCIMSDDQDCHTAALEFPELRSLLDDFSTSFTKRLARCCLTGARTNRTTPNQNPI